MTARLSWDITGQPGAPVVVLLSPIGCTGEIWEPLLGRLGEELRVVRIDTRGHGRSPAGAAGGPVGIADLGRDVLECLAEVRPRLDVTRVHLIGLSLGGMTAMWLAAHHPDVVGRLVLACTSAYLPPAARWLERAAAVRAGGMSTVAGLPASTWVTPAYAEREPAAIERLEAMLGTVDPEAYAQCCEAIATMDLRPDLPRIAAPTLVIAATADTAIPPALVRETGRAIPGATVAEVAGAGHLATAEHPAELALLALGHLGAGATLAAGFRTRTAVLGAEHVTRAQAGTTELTAPFQDLVTRYAWGDVWSRPGLSRRDRSVATLAALVTLGAEAELGMHVKAALRNGLSRQEVAEVLLHTALYAGLPRANRALALAQQALAEADDTAPEEG